MITDVLKALYTGSISEIYSILNRCVYITEIQDKQDALLFHTGFGFKSHKGTMFYLYYDLKSGIVVRSPEIKNPLYGKIPQLLGILCPLNGSEFINNFYPELITSLILGKSNQDEDNIELKGLKGISQFTLGKICEPNNLQVLNKAVTLASSDGTNRMTHETFEIQKEEQIIASLPLYNTFSQVVFINHKTLEQYDLNKYKGETQKEWQSDEDWYRSEFGDAANDAWWNTH